MWDQNLDFMPELHVFTNGWILSEISLNVLFYNLYFIYVSTYTIIFLFNAYLFMWPCICHDRNMEIRGQLSEISSFFILWNPNIKLRSSGLVTITITC